MSLVKQAYSRFRSFGGLRLLREYIRLGLAGFVLNRVFLGLLKGYSLKRIYAQIGERTSRILCERYRAITEERLASYDSMGLEHKRSGTVWFCWLQGMEDAPLLVKACLNAVRTNMPDRKVIVITKENYNSYVSLPDFIVGKWERGIMPPAMFADLLRLELLISHGGVWIDSTVLCTGWENNEWLRRNAEAAMDSDLFFFRYVSGKTKRFAGIGNWFIAAKTNNTALMVLRDVLVEYWKDYDCVLDYYIFHRLFSLIAAIKPQIVDEMPKGLCVPCLQLGHRLADRFDEGWWKTVTGSVCFHKMNYRKEREAMRIKDSYCSHIVEMFSDER